LTFLVQTLEKAIAAKIYVTSTLPNMPARDIFHNSVKNALKKDGWTITHDPLALEFGLGSLYVDLGAERIIAAERKNEKIAVEIKSFLGGSAVSEFHTALGQYLNYRLLMQDQYPEYKLYLAIPLSVYDSFFQLLFVQNTIRQHQLKLAIYLPEEEAIAKWLD